MERAAVFIFCVVVGACLISWSKASMNDALSVPTLDPYEGEVSIFVPTDSIGPDPVKAAISAEMSQPSNFLSYYFDVCGVTKTTDVLLVFKDGSDLPDMTAANDHNFEAAKLSEANFAPPLFYRSDRNNIGYKAFLTSVKPSKCHAPRDDGFSCPTTVGSDLVNYIDVFGHPRERYLVVNYGAGEAHLPRLQSTTDEPFTADGREWVAPETATCAKINLWPRDAKVADADPKVPDRQVLRWIGGPGKSYGATWTSKSGEATRSQSLVTFGIILGIGASLAVEAMVIAVEFIGYRLRRHHHRATL